MTVVQQVLKEAQDESKRGDSAELKQVTAKLSDAIKEKRVMESQRNALEAEVVGLSTQLRSLSDELEFTQQTMIKVTNVPQSAII